MLFAVATSIALLSVVAPSPQQKARERRAVTIDSATIHETWRTLAAYPHVQTDTGLFLSFMLSESVNELLLANDDDVEVLARLWDLGVDPSSLVFLRVETIPDDELTQPIKNRDLESLRDNLLKSANPDAVRLTDMELWIGSSTDTTSAVTTNVALLVGVTSNRKQLVLGLVGQTLYGECTAEPQEIYGSWLCKAYPPDKQVRDVEDGMFETSTVQPLKVNVAAVKSKFGICFSKCFKKTSPGFSIAQIICLVAAAVACLASALGWPVCFLVLGGLCAVGISITQLLACSVVCI